MNEIFLHLKLKKRRWNASRITLDSLYAAYHLESASKQLALLIFVHILLFIKISVFYFSFVKLFGRLLLIWKITTCLYQIQCLKLTSMIYVLATSSAKITKKETKVCFYLLIVIKHQIFIPIKRKTGLTCINLYH